MMEKERKHLVAADCVGKFFLTDKKQKSLLCSFLWNRGR